MTVCRHCAGEFTATVRQIAKSDYECAPCQKIRLSNWRAARKAAGRPVISSRMSREYHRAYEAEYLKNPENRARKNAQMRLYAKAHGTAEHHKARRKVRSEIEAGRMHRQPCEICGAEKAEAHHDDYSKPLDVRWLCPQHHRERHAKAQGAA